MRAELLKQLVADMSPLCVPTSSCASWIATDAPITTTEPSPPSTPAPPPPPPPTTTPTIPLQTSGPVCNNEADFPGHDDISKSTQGDYAKEVCDLWRSHADMDPSSPELSDGPVTSKAHYNYSVSWIDGCITTVPSQSLVDPLGQKADVHCHDIFVDAYKQCKSLSRMPSHLALVAELSFLGNNGGVGGYIDAGCLRYRFDVGK